MATFTVHGKTLEDFLATDDLFVEYFNSYLALPSFPEPLCFNKDTGGFEVVSNAKKDLAQQIKAAIRSQRRMLPMYRVAKEHSFMDLPLIPIEEPSGPEKMEIDTSFTVTTLNKEQGIHWVKAERLPAFLESDCYLEYRLANIVSQVKLSQDNKQFAIMKIDYKPRPKKSRKKDDDEPKIDPKVEMIKNMYVCMGNATTTEAESWFTDAHMAQTTETTFSTLTRPRSADRPASARPASVMGLTDLSKRCDSGYGSPCKSSVFSSSYFGTPSRLGAYPGEIAEDDGGYPVSSFKPNTPRPSDAVCVVSGEDGQKTSRATVYAYPKSEQTDTESGMGDTEEDREEEMSNDTTGDSQSESGLPRQDTEESVVVDSVDDLGAVIVGTVLKRCIANIINVDEKTIAHDPQIQDIFPQKKYSYITMDMLEHVSFGTGQEEVTPEEEEKEEEVELSRLEEKKEESDVDSLLDSEEDYEEQDLFFRKHKHRSYGLIKWKGVQQFKKFLQGTLGERHWNLWVDIDRSRMIKSEEEQLLYLSNMRERYQNPGSLYELSTEWKRMLGLVEPANWTVEKLLSVQNRIAEPLVLYWAPRFLLKQLVHSNPDKNFLYHHQQQLKKRQEVYPNPPTASLLPLRPRSCMPRTQHSTVITEALPPMEMDIFNSPTSPPVGLRRVYCTSPRPSPTHKHGTDKRKPRELLSPKLKVDRVSSSRAKSATSRAQTATSRQKSPRHTSSRPISAMSESSDSWESASVMSDRLSPRQSSRPVSGRPISGRPVSGRLSSRLVEDHKPRAKTSSGNRLRPTSAASDLSMSTVSEFKGGRRMEALLQALHHEKTSGGFFRKFVDRSGNMLWMSALDFWTEVQDYHLLFYADIMDPYTLKKKAKAIYSQYIVRSAPRDIDCAGPIRDEIYRCIDPPYEELFDAAEEHSLSILYAAWLNNLDDDVKTYSKVELIDVKRHLETKSKYVLHLQKRGLIKERVLTPDDPMEGYEDPVYDESLLENIPEEFRDYTLEKLVHNRIELEHFRQFLADNYASMDLMCWMDIEAWRRITHTDEKKRDQKAKEIKTKYLNKKYFFGPNSPAGRDGQDKVMNAGGGWGKLLDDRPPNSVLLEAQKYVRERLEKKWLPIFLATPDFEERQRPRTSMDDVVDDVMVQRRRRSQALSKLLESRWISSSNEIVTFRKALLNPVTSVQFRRYVSIKGDNLENDVLFWLEVQKYKELYHANTDDALIMQKINAIINCFIDSQIPPSLQIDIPSELGEKILDRKYEKGPYLFREAQLTVFRILFSQWNDFCEFRANITEEKIMTTIERRRRHAKARQRRNQQDIDDKNAKERERRIAMGLPVDGSEADDLYVDPFKVMDESEAELEEREGDKLTWTYSNYMRALEKEDLLNNTDESMFSSLTDTNSMKELNLEKIAEELERGDSPSPSTKKSFKSEETQTSSSRKTGSKDQSPRGSPDPVQGKSQKQEEINTSSRTAKSLLQHETKQKSDKGQITLTKKGQGKTTPPTSDSHPGSTVQLIDPKEGKLKLSRQIPPLVQKK